MVSKSSEDSKGSASSFSKDDTKNDPDYEPTTDDSESTGTYDVDSSIEEEDEEEESANNILRQLAPIFATSGSRGGRSIQMPLMFVIQTGQTKKHERNSDDEEKQDEDEDENHECDACRRHIRFKDEEEELDRELEKVGSEIEKEENEKKLSRRKRNRSNNDIKSIMEEYSPEERSYINKLAKEDKDRVLQTELRIKKLHQDTSSLPMRFKIIDSPMDDGSKRIILAKLEQFQRMYEGSGEYYKLRNWLNAVNRLPLGRFKQLPIIGDPNNSDDVEKVSRYLSSIKSALDGTVYGHREAKEQILRILAQWISNPNSCGHCIGIQGPPGCGKTSLVKDGICKALGLPFALISLGCYGSDGSGLTGHHVTYEGSTYGKISESLMKAQHMNPILYFDELDKISTTPKGEEVTNVLIHLTDSTQNEHFSDNYFSEIPLDLSKCLIIFSYNDESLINPILKDRMITIHVSGYTKKEKVEIAQNYLIPRILATYNLKKEDIVFDNSVIEEIIERVADEQGVRNLKRGIDSIVSWINMRRYVPNIAPSATKEKDESVQKIEFPIKINTQLVKKYIQNNDSSMKQHVMASMYL